MTKVSVKKRLLTNKPLLGLCNMYPAEGIVERIGKDWDWVWIDGQHGQHDYHSILSTVRVCDALDVPSIVRVPGHEYGTIGRVLDTCASGIMVPMVNTVDQAKAVVDAVKFPPLGIRSYGGRRPIDVIGRAYAHTANEDVFLIAQIETKEGLKNADAIAAIDGIDALFFGPDDMSMQDGLRMDVSRDVSELVNLMKIMFDAAKKYGKIAGSTSPTPELYKAAVKLGYRLIVATGDVNLLVDGSKATQKQFQQYNDEI